MKWLLIIIAYHGGVSNVWYEDLASCQRAADYAMMLGKRVPSDTQAGCVQGAPALVPPVTVNVQPTRTIEHQVDRVKIDVNVKHK